MFVSSVVIAFVYSWRITLICVIVGPLSVVTMAVMARLSSSSLRRIMSVSSEAGAMAEEAIMDVKTVAACNAQKHMVKKYEHQLKMGKHFVIRYSFLSGFFEGLMFFQLYVFYATVFLYGIISYYHGVTAEPGTVFIIAGSIWIGAYFFGLLGPHVRAIAKARLAASIVYEAIDLVEDSTTTSGQPLTRCYGRIEFKDVRFKYPTRNTPVLKGLSWVADPGETIALVGKSGCGKSTSIGLLTRLYDHDDGSILIDGRDIRSLNTSDLRKMIGVVEQEPCLFNGTIRENIVLGRAICEADTEEAARTANAHDFIMKLEKGYETVIDPVGSRCPVDRSSVWPSPEQ